METTTQTPAAPVDVPGYLTKTQVAERFQKCEKTTERWCKDGILPHIKLGEGKSATLLFDWEDAKRRLKDKFGANVAC